MPLLGPDGVTMTEGRYRPTDVCDAGIADKLGIRAAYLRRTRDSHPALFDANVNGWLEREMEQHAGHRVTDAPKAIEVIGARLRYTEAQQQEILDHFIAGGSLTAGGMARYSSQ
jgi:hypothetical protein